uniref:Uncharacterized protein n=1 Tax=Brassica oleracea TaxID=3712 RepID=A0A3P6FRF1_BRAOL|nr:unnamed protein product [Brassica oleracea]
MVVQHIPIPWISLVSSSPLRLLVIAHILALEGKLYSLVFGSLSLG